MKIKALSFFSIAIVSLGLFGRAEAATLNLQGASTTGQVDAAGGLRFENVVSDPTAGMLDLIVRATDAFDTYDAANTSKNGVSGAFGQINLRNNTLTGFEFRLVADGGSIDDVVAPEEFTVTFLDLDGAGGSTSLLPADAPSELRQFETISVATPSLSVSGSALDIDDRIAGQTTFVGTFAAGGSNNPSSTNLTLEQSSIAVAVTFENQGIFEFSFGAGAGNPNSGRNFLFGGEVVFAEDAVLTTTATAVPEGGTVLGLLLAGAAIAGCKFCQHRTNFESSDAKRANAFAG